jgi:hypothetical protein
MREPFVDVGGLERDERYYTPDCLPKLFSSLAILQINARDITTGFKFDELLSLLDTSSMLFDIIVVTESWLTDDCCQLYNIPGYSSIFNNRHNTRGGGVALFIREGFAIENTEIYSSNCESVQITKLKITRLNRSYIIVGMYNNHRNNYELLLNALDGLLDTLTENSILVGDTNINTIVEDTISGTYGSFVATRGYEHCVTLITRPVSGTCLDHILLGNITNLVECHAGVIDTRIFSDHNPTFTSFNVLDREVPKDSSLTEQYIRNLGLGYQLKFALELDKVDWTEFYKLTDPDSALEQFTSRLSYLYNFCFPIRSRCGNRLEPLSPRTRNKWPNTLRESWFDSELRILRRDTDNLHKKYIKYRLPRDKIKYYASRDVYRKNLKLKKDSYYESLTESLKSSPKKTWEFVNKSCGRAKKQTSITGIRQENVIITDKKMMANIFNGYFDSAGNSGKDQLEDPDFPLSYFLNKIQPLQSPFTFNEILPYTLTKILLQTKCSLKGASKEIPSLYLRKFYYYLIDPLTFILNLSIRSGKYPDKLKSAKIIPLYKGEGSRLEPSKYRPISILPFISKLFERCLNKQLSTFLETNNFFSPNQYGFRSGRSTELALAHITDKITEITDRRDIPIGLFLDTSKAFDCLDHSIFDQILTRLGFSELSRSWFSSYLGNREKCVILGNQRSDTLNSNIGIPQGSVMGPTIYLIYQNGLLDIHADNTDISPYGFADDVSNIYSLSISKVYECLLRLNYYLREISAWYKAFKLKLNILKTKLLIFLTQSNGFILPTPLIFDGLELTPSDSVKCLGIILSANLKWTDHSTSLRPKLRYINATLHRLRLLRFNKDLLILLYRALFESVLTYCATIWGGAYDTVLRPLEILQNDSLRTILGIKRSEPHNIDKLYETTGILRIGDRIKLLVGTFMYKHQRSLIPVDSSFVFRQTRARRKVKNHPLVSIKHRLDLRGRSVRFMMAKIWNLLDPSIRDAANLRLFKIQMLGWLKSCNRA